MANGKKTGGRLRGSPNKATAEMRRRIASVLDAIDIEAELKTLTASERVKVWITLSEFVAPKMERSNPIIEAELDELKTELQKLKQLKPNEVKNNVQNPNRDAEIRAERSTQTLEESQGIGNDGISETRA
jgi:hypothetical protein